MTDITPIVNAAIVLLATIITVFVIPYIEKKKVYIQSVTTAEQQAFISAIVKTSVFAFEQIIQGEGLGAKRFINVMDDVQKQLESKGITFDYDRIKLQIEAAVLEMKTSQGK